MKNYTQIMNPSPLVSIIILNYSGEKLLQNCLESLYSTNYSNYEVILVDNHSIDNSVNFVKTNFPKVEIIELNKNFGFAAPNNLAAKTARGKYIVFLNNDTTVTPSWLSELVSCMENDKKIAIAQSLLIRPNGEIDSSGDFVDSLGRSYSRTITQKEIGYILSARAACMITRKDLFLDFGGFDENYFASFEDVEIGWRAWLWGYKVVIVPTSIVYHIGGETISQIPNIIAFHGVKNNLLLRFTNLGFFDFIKSIFFIISIILSQKVFGKSFGENSRMNFNVPDFNTLFKGSFWVLKNFKTVINKRKLVKSRQVRTNKDLKKMGLITK